jgi:cation diffusion facilitator family transporter
MERKALLVSVLASLLTAIFGIAFAHLSSSEAILLDGLFNLTYFVTGLFTLRVAALLHRPDDDRFPYGYAYFEPLVNGVKGALVLGVTAAAGIRAVTALFTGGREVDAGPAVIYGFLAATASFAVCGYLFRVTRTHHSPILLADAKNWFLDGMISFAVLLAFVGVMVIKETVFQGWAPYIDPTAVLLVVAISIAMPAREAWTALMQLLNRAPSPAVLTRIDRLVRQSIATLDVPQREIVIRVLEPGRVRMVMVHVVLPADFTASVKRFDEIRAHLTEPLRNDHPLTLVDVAFTADLAYAGPWTPGEPA